MPLKFNKPQNNFNSLVIPTINDDSSLGYEYGSQWINTISGLAYICTDSTMGNAVWVLL